MTYNEKLNFVFGKAFSINGEPMAFEITKLSATGFKNEAKEKGIENHEYDAIVIQLISEGYLIKYEEKSMREARDYICPSIKGYSVYNMGGFAKKQEAEDISQNILRLDEIHKKMISKSLNCATWFAGIVAALLLGWNVFEFFYERCHY